MKKVIGKMKILKSKSGLTWAEDWVEIVSIAAIVVGFFLSLSAGSAIINYVLILIIGFLVGRVIYQRKHKFKFAFIIITALFLLGYLLGNRYGSTLITLLFFIVGSVGSYRLHHKGYIK